MRMYWSTDVKHSAEAVHLVTQCIQDPFLHSSSGYVQHAAVRRHWIWKKVQDPCWSKSNISLQCLPWNWHMAAQHPCVCSYQTHVGLCWSGQRMSFEAITHQCHTIVTPSCTMCMAGGKMEQDI